MQRLAISVGGSAHLRAAVRKVLCDSAVTKKDAAESALYDVFMAAQAQHAILTLNSAFSRAICMGIYHHENQALVIDLDDSKHGQALRARGPSYL